MKTLDLKNENVSLEDLLELASVGSVRILAPDGHVFVIEEDDEFGKEVQLLGGSEKFGRFLDERSKEPAAKSLEEYRKSLD
jgi:hypothetical protein